MGFVAYPATVSRYTAMLKNYVVLELLQRNALNDIVWMQDGVPPHVAKSVRRVLEQHFGDRIILRHFFSVASAIPRSDSYEFLVLRIYQI